MTMLRFIGLRQALGAVVLGCLVACGSVPKPTPAAIGDVKVQQALTPAWSFKFSSVNQLHQSLPVVNDKVAIAAADGAVARIDAAELERLLSREGCRRAAEYLAECLDAAAPVPTPEAAP